MRVNQVVKIKAAGRCKGLVGVVVEVEEKRALVHVEGVKDGEAIMVSQWFPVGFLEVVK